MGEIGYETRIEVYEVLVHKAAAVGLESIVGLCGGCGKVDWMKELAVDKDGRSTCHVRCRMGRKWNAPPRVERPVPDKGSGCVLEHNGEGYKVTFAGALPSGDMRFDFNRNKSAHLSPEEVAERVRM